MPFQLNGPKLMNDHSIAPNKLERHEACLNRDDAFRRERFFKTGKGKRFLKNRLTAYLDSIAPNKLERH